MTRKSRSSYASEETDVTTSSQEPILAESSLFDDDDPRLAASDLCVARVCTRLRLALADSGLRQKDLAERLSVKPAVISRWLSGRSNIGIRALSDLAWAIGCELDVDFIDTATGRRSGALRSNA